MEHKSCPVFVDGKECGRPLTRVDLEAEKIARFLQAFYSRPVADIGGLELPHTF